MRIELLLLLLLFIVVVVAVFAVVIHPLHGIYLRRISLGFR
jgi:hypothetical protein